MRLNRSLRVSRGRVQCCVGDALSSAQRILIERKLDFSINSDDLAFGTGKIKSISLRKANLILRHEDIAKLDDCLWLDKQGGGRRNSDDITKADEKIFQTSWWVFFLLGCLMFALRVC